MATSIAFDLIPVLVEQFGTEVPAGTQVLLGFGASDDPGDFLMVGVDDPNSPDPLAPSASGTQTWAGLGANHRDEDGTVTCAALAWTGDADATEDAIARVKAIVAAVEAHITADPNLGGAVPGLLWVRPEGRTQLMLGGGQAMFVFDLAYRARL